MEEILRSLGYDETVISNFRREGVSLEAVSVLTMAQLEQLGVCGMGRQAVLRGRCRNNTPGTSNRRTSSVPDRQAVAKEARQLFSPYPGHRNRRKKSVTLCLSVMCLSSRSTTKVPSTFTQRVLAECGLGEKRVELPSDASPSEVMDIICNYFPKLRQCDGFEYLKADGSSKQFREIPLPKGGFTAANLKASARQARIYIRPVQCDIELSNTAMSAQTDEHEIMHKCKKCDKLIGQTKLRRHIKSCGDRREPDDSDKDDEDDVLLLESPFQSTSSNQADTVKADTTPSSVAPSTHSHTRQPSEVAASAQNMETNAISCTRRPLDESDIEQTNTPSDGHSASSSLATDQAEPMMNSDHEKPSTSGNNSTRLASSSERYVTEYNEIMEPASQSDDEELRFVMQESLRDLDEPSDSIAMDAQMQRMVTEYQMQRKEEQIVIIVRRKKLIRSALDAIIHQKGFSFLKAPVINFSGEEAVDLGGPKREFFTLATQQIPSLGIFEGLPGKIYFSHDIDFLEKGLYKLAGQIIAWSILHEGPGFPMLHPGLFDMLVNRPSKDEDQIKVTDLTDSDVVTFLSTIENISTQQMADQAVLKVGDWAANNGCSNIYSLTVENKGKHVQSLIKQHVFYRCKSEVDCFKEGLESVGGLWSFIQADPLPFRKLFVASERPLTFLTMKGLFKVAFSEGNDCDSEEETVFCWEQFLRKCEDAECNTNMVMEDKDTESFDIGLHHVLRFCTGADAIPPAGFSKRIDLKFYTPSTGERSFPVAHTCGLELHLPRGVTESSSFSKLMVEAILCSPGFGKM